MRPQLAIVGTTPETSAQQKAFVLADMSRRYGGRWALVRLSYELPVGTSLLLTGHNGSGKTTLLKCLATSLRPSLGKLTVLGHDAKTDADAIRRQVALLSHASYLYEELTAQQNLSLLARLVGHPDPDGVANDFLCKVGLAPRAHHAVRQFSAGMKKRLAIARLLLKQPALALLDEPFGELDPAGIDQMEGFIHELKAKGSTLVLATHLVEQGQRLTTARLHLEQGRQVAP